MTKQHIPTQKFLKYTPPGPGPVKYASEISRSSQNFPRPVFLEEPIPYLYTYTSVLPLQSSSSRYFKFLLPGPNIAIKIPTTAISSIATVTNTATCKRDGMQCRVLLPLRCPDSEWFSVNSKPDVIVMLNLLENRSWSMQNSWFQAKTLWKLSTDYTNVELCMYSVNYIRACHAS